MNKFLLHIALLSLLTSAPAQSPAPLTLVRTIEMPDVPIGPYSDHLAVDLKGNRLFATPQARKSVQVFDLTSGKLLQNISGFENPHSVLYRSDLDRIYVTDGGAGQLKIFSGRDYHLIQSVKLLPDADSIGYDPATKFVYVTNGGEGAKLDYSLLSAIDTEDGKLVGELKVPAGSLEAMTLEAASPRIYIDVTDKNEVAVIDRRNFTVLATWPVTKGKRNIAMALDESHHRLFVGCRNTESSGAIVVFDTLTGKELQAMPIAGWVDYLSYDPASRRLYATCGQGPEGNGWAFVYQQVAADSYHLLGKVATAPKGKAGLFVPELELLFVSIPHFANTPAEVLVFRNGNKQPAD
ncbi:MAG: YncE family protein [Candidatus Sulfotelmatobacter sp.]